MERPVRECVGRRCCDLAERDRRRSCGRVGSDGVVAVRNRGAEQRNVAGQLAEPW